MTTHSPRRRAILDAASRLFAHYGHAKMTIADVAREANIAVGSVYKEFDSKEALIEELSGRAHVEVLEAMRDAARQRSSDGFAARLTAVVVARTTAFVALRAQGQHASELLFCKADGVAAARARFREEEQLVLWRLLEDGRERGEVAPVDLRETAELVQRAFATLSPPFIFGDAEGASRVARRMSELLLSGLLARGSARAARVPSSSRATRSPR